MGNWTPPESSLGKPPSSQQSLFENASHATSITAFGDVNQAMSANLADLLARVKAQHSPGQAVTKEDLTLFVKMIMQNWTTSRSHKMPSKGNVRGGIEERSTKIGVLKQDCVVPPNGKSMSAVSLADRHKITKNQPANKQTDHWRKMGAPVYMRVIAQPGAASFYFQFHDGRSRIISSANDICKFVPGMSKPEDRFFEAMAAYDSFLLEKVHGYNLAMAVYYARNRLVYWASGADIAGRPDGEDMENFIPYKLCKDMSGPSSSGMEEAVQKLNNTLSFDLFNRLL